MIASTRISYSGYNDNFMLGMVDAIWPEFLPGNTTAGLTNMVDVMNAGKAYMLSQAGLGYTDFRGADLTITQTEALTALEEFHWFGDPASSIRTMKPSYSMMVTKPTLMNSLFKPVPLNILVSRQDGIERPQAPVANARVTVSRPDNPNDYWTGLTDSEGNITFSEFQATSGGLYDVVAIADDAVPYTGTLEVQPGSGGGIIMDSWGYTCDDIVNVNVADADLAGMGVITVTVTTSRADGELLRLEEQSPGIFEGRIHTEVGRISPNDGGIQVQDDDAIWATYLDTTGGGDASGMVQDFAVVDCRPPDFYGAAPTIVQGCKVRLQWPQASDLHGPVLYSVYRDQALDGNLGDLIVSTFANTYLDTSVACGQRYYYVVRAQDRFDNLEDNLVEVEAVLPGIYLPLVLR